MFGLPAFGGIGGGFGGKGSGGGIGLGGVGLAGLGLLGIATVSISLQHSITTSRECAALSVQAASLASWPDRCRPAIKNDSSAMLAMQRFDKVIGQIVVP